MNQKIARSKGMTDLYLVQNHAHFLSLARDLKALLSYGTKLPELFLQTGLTPTGPDHADLANEYYRVLIDLYRERNQPDEELGILYRLKMRKALTRKEQLEGGGILLAQDDLKEALEWLESIELNQSQPSVEISTLRLLAQAYSSTETVEKEKFAELTRQALKYDDNDLILYVADQLNEAGFGAMAESALLLRIRSSLVGTDKPALLLGLINGRLSRGETFDRLGSELQALLSALDPTSERVADWFELVRSAIQSNPQEARQAFPHPTPTLKRTCSPVLLQLTDNLIARALAAKGVPLLHGLDPASMSEAELICVLEQLIKSKQGKDAAQLMTEYAAATERPLGFEHPARMIKTLASLQDSTRVAELHARLMDEPISETFRRRLRLKVIPSFNQRQNLPGVFAEAGYPELAGSLYRAYLDAIQKDGRVPGDFLSDYANFLTRIGDYPAAEDLFIRSFRRSSSSDDETILDSANSLMNLYTVWNSAENLQQRMARYHLTSGLRVRVEEILDSRPDDKKSIQH